MILETKYRDIPIEEIEKAHTHPSFLPISPDERERWEGVRKTSVTIDTNHRSERGCIWFKVVNGWGCWVCAHTAEIGD